MGEKKNIEKKNKQMMENHDNFNGIKINCHLIGLKKKYNKKKEDNKW